MRFFFVLAAAALAAFPAAAQSGLGLKPGGYVHYEPLSFGQNYGVVGLEDLSHHLLTAGVVREDGWDLGPLPDGRALRPSKILCIGRNYADHVREMGDVEGLPSEPVIFLKPPSALLADGGTIELPKQSEDVHHEVELVAVIGKGGKHIAEADALDHVAGYALGLDLTARDIQRKAKDSGKPWSVAKGFDTFAPLGPVVAAEEVGDVQRLDIQLAVNGDVRQSGNTGQMLFPIARLVSLLSEYFTLEPGDLIYTGTPEGVGPVQDGDVLEATGANLPQLTVRAKRP